MASAKASPEQLREARKYYKRGKAAFELGRFKKALENYEEAYRVAALPGLLFNIGQCYRNIAEPEKAVFSFRLYLRKVPNARNREAVLTLIRELDKEIARKQDKERRRRAEEARRKREEEERREEERRRREAESGKGTASTPVYKKWWFWTIVGVAVAAGAGAGVYFGTRKSGPDLPASPFPSWEL